MVDLTEFVEGPSSSSSVDVFLSFRGCDTRDTFIDHLHKALMDADITTFLDDEMIETKEDLKPEVGSVIKTGKDLKLEPESVIRECRASIIVLSKNYANSPWCLDELVLILEQRMSSNQIVVPVFYHVEPTHVRKQEGTFGLAMAEHKQRMEVETDANKRNELTQKIDKWKKALTEVANLNGKDVNGRRETEFIEEIVKDIYRKLHVPIRSDLPLLIGMESSIKFITSWLKDASSLTEDVLTILGMGGIGKTSLAKYVYKLHSHEFDTSSFIEDISRRCDERIINRSSYIEDISPKCENFNGLLGLQKQLYDDISEPSSIQVHDVSIYTSKIEKAVAHKKVFLVLDDIDSLDQLDALLGSEDFSPRSKIIITTMDRRLTESCALFRKKVKKPKHDQLLLNGLDDTQSRKLLCFHAFMSNDPKAGYEEVSEKLVKHCEGHPLALEVLGKSLHNRDVAYWEECIDELKKEIDSRIYSALRKSFDSLPSKNDRELFKHIACFFVGMDRDITETILRACGINTSDGFMNVINRCLLSIGWDSKIKMHQLLQHMGRFIVREESPHKPWERSRLWCHEESLKVLLQKKGTGKVLGLTLDMKMLEKEKLRETFELKTGGLSKMDKLMLLQLNYVRISGSYGNFPEKLRWLCMHGFSLKSIPSDLPMENVVALDMSYSYIKSFGICYSNTQQPEKRPKLSYSSSKEKKLFGSLKILNLSFCDQLHSLGGFEELPALERLIVRNCIGLVEVCESIEQCFELILIDLSNCNKLENLPRTICMLKKVNSLLVGGCNLGESRNAVTNPKTHSFATLNDLESVEISLPSSLVSLSFANNNMLTESFPMDLSRLSTLKELYLDDNPIVSLPDFVRSLPRLETLSMSNCKELTSVERPPHTLRELILRFDSKPLLRKVVFHPEMLPLKLSFDLSLFIPSSFEIEGMVKIQPMAGVEKEVLLSLGWTNLDFLHERRLQTNSLARGSEESEIQMYYEFGIFSTIYGGEDIPNWISLRSKGPSVSFTIPSSPHNIIGLNFCCMQPFLSLKKFFEVPVITIKNITKNQTWLYKHCIDVVSVGGYSVILLSHWMFGMNEMEGGDQVTITVNSGFTKECGVSFVYDDGKTDEEEDDDVLGYYKSWNHIIGGDMSAFRLTTGEYILHTWRFMQISNAIEFSHHFIKCGIAADASFKESKVCFRALFPRKSIILGHAREINRESGQDPIVTRHASLRRFWEKRKMRVDIPKKELNLPVELRPGEEGGSTNTDFMSIYDQGLIGDIPPSYSVWPWGNRPSTGFISSSGQGLIGERPLSFRDLAEGHRPNTGFRSNSDQGLIGDSPPSPVGFCGKERSEPIL